MDILIPSLGDIEEVEVIEAMHRAGEFGVCGRYLDCDRVGQSINGCAGGSRWRHRVLCRASG